MVISCYATYTPHCGNANQITLMSINSLYHFVFLIRHRWNSCKQNKQAANNRAATSNQMVTPEGEKLHSDSGISVDTQSLQEQQQQQAQAEVQAPPSQSHSQDQIGKPDYIQYIVMMPFTS